MFQTARASTQSFVMGDGALQVFAGLAGAVLPAAAVHCLHWRAGASGVIDCCRCGAEDVSLQAAGVPMLGPVRACADGLCAITR